jgi:hypothetical protein
MVLSNVNQAKFFIPVQSTNHMMTTKFKGLNLIFMLSAINITLSEILTGNFILL